VLTYCAAVYAKRLAEDASQNMCMHGINGSGRNHHEAWHEVSQTEVGFAVLTQEVQRIFRFPSEGLIRRRVQKQSDIRRRRESRHQVDEGPQEPVSWSHMYQLVVTAAIDNNKVDLRPPQPREHNSEMQRI